MESDLDLISVRSSEILTVSLSEFFKEKIEESCSNQHVSVEAETEFYLVNLLVAPSNLDTDEPLAFMLKRAQEGDSFERSQGLKRLGDTSLYVSGFFADSLEPKLVDQDYYISMGSAAYSLLDSMFPRSVYGELSNKFDRLVDVLAEVSYRTTGETPEGLLRIYERFLRTGSARSAIILMEHGLNPMSKPGLIQ